MAEVQREYILNPESDGELENEDDISPQLSENEEDSDTDTDFENEGDQMELENEDLNDGHLSWNRPFAPQVIEFHDPINIVRDEMNISGSTTYFEIVRKFLTDAIIQDIVTESNRFVSQVKESNGKAFTKWKHLEIPEFWRFTSVTIMMGLIKKSSLKDYWTTDPFFSTPFFAKIMTRDRFQDILRSLHFVNNRTVSQGNTDRFIKLGTFLPNLLAAFKRAINPSKLLCIDESLLGYKGRLSFKQYNPKKRARFGIKFFMMADCRSKLILDIVPYQGKSTKIQDRNWIRDLGFGGAAVLTLLQTYIGKHHQIIADNWFMSPTLASRLLDQDTYILGTVQKKRKGMPKVMGRKLLKGEIETYSNGNLLVERWMDRREVCMLNSFVPHGMTASHSANPVNNRLKPDTVLIYNQNMGALDDCDKIIKPFQSIRKTYKWYKKVAFHLFDIAYYNSHLVYCLSRPAERANPSYKAFLMNLVKEITQTFPAEVVTKGRPSGSDVSLRLVGYHPLKQVTKWDGSVLRSDCHYCKLLGVRKSSSFTCTACNKRLCTKGENSCFNKYHSLRTLPVKKKKQNLAPRGGQLIHIQTQPSDFSQSQSLLNLSVNQSQLSSNNTESDSVQTNSNSDSSSTATCTSSESIPLSVLYSDILMN